MSCLVLVLVCWCVAGVSAADEGDDFSNNLFSDLAPLLALFGERVTMQFMSQSMGWADHIILAMGPLGILTVVVGAIRVGGPTWLKALVGRAMENLAAAEMDILSSTSPEVCELWNGEQVVRCMGPSPVTEFIVLKPEGKLESPPKVVVLDWDDAFKKYLKETSSLFTHLVMRFNSKLTSSSASSFGGDIKGRLSSLKKLVPRINFSQFLDLASRGKSQSYESSAERGAVNNPLTLPGSAAATTASGTTDNGVPSTSSSSSENSSSEIIVIRNTSKHVPNISLNCHKGSRRWELWLCATIGSILQLGVIVYCGFATYYRTLRFPKDGKQIAGYSYPCTAIGTLLLVTGVMLCSHVVESKTLEKRYVPLNGMKATMVWLQQEKTVNDQSFDSYAVYFTKGDDPIITSERSPNEKSTSETLGGDKTTSQRLPDEKTTSGTLPDKQSTSDGISLTTITSEIETIICTIVTICGFIIQFVGLRGMHWSASVTQLGIVLIMVAVKAWVRRGLASPPFCTKLLPGYELEWLSRILGDANTVNSMSSGLDLPESPDMKEWTMEDFELSDLLQEVEEGDSKAHHLMQTRLSLGKLAAYCDGPPKRPTWSGHSSGESVAVARSIGTVMDALFPGDKEGSYTWSVKSSKGLCVNFRVQRQLGRGWKVYSDEIEAALSLWLFAVEIKSHKGRSTRAMKPVLVKDTEDDSWLEAKGLSAKPFLSILGPYSLALHRDIWWWMPTRESEFLVLKTPDLETQGSIPSESQSDVVLAERYAAIVGRGFDRANATMNNVTRLQAYNFETPELKDNSEPLGDSTTSFLATPRHIPRRLASAQDMFCAFMWGATANPKANPRFGKALLRPDTEGGVDNWKSSVVTNERIAKMALDVQQTGLGSLEQIYQCLLPPLSAKKKLPEPEAIIDLARKEARVHEQRNRWEEAGEIYISLYGTMKLSPL
ncbi:unnamed protein product [Clonostachys rosea]|uniref:Uncharacterized protein n=1 Tax=Bionectria ochroleuca TaxID=29856 RepID=A0ABY6TVD6_BIOOC|nr:unnamed protein product [Clonostachys rosea]